MRASQSRTRTARPTAPSKWDPAWRRESEEWIRARVDVTGPIEDVRLRPWAAVLRVPTPGGAVYFKEADDSLAHEARLIEILARRRPELVTDVVVSDERGRMLMRDAGKALHAVLDRDLDLRYWEEALPLYAELQIETAPDADELIAVGAFDRRAAILFDVYEGLVAQPAEGQTPEEYAELCRFVSEVERICAQLVDAPIPETINNDDLTDGSIFVGDRSYRFLDWGDACLSHPFFTLTVTQRIIEIRHGLPVRSAEIARVRDAYLEPFTRFTARAELEELVEPARRIGQICRLALRAENPFWDDPGELAWAFRLLLDPEAWRRWNEVEQPPRQGPVS